MSSHLEKKDQPEIWFFKTEGYESNNDYPNAYPLPNQVFPIMGKENEWLEGDTSYKASFNRELRREKGEGAIFYATNAHIITEGANGKPRKPSYKATQEGFLKYTNQTIPDSVPESVKKAWNDLCKGKVPKIYSEDHLKEADELMDDVIKSMGTSPLDKALSDYPVPTIADDGHYVDKDVWATLLANIVIDRENTLLTGPAGTGKTELLMLLGNKIGLPLHVHDMAGMQDPVASLVGKHMIKDGNSMIDQAPFSLHIGQKGLILLDELSRAPRSANNLLLPILDNRRFLPNPLADSTMEDLIKVSDEAFFVATANEGINYTGTSQLDQALRERFEPVEIDYLPEEIEVDLLIKRTGVNKKMAQLIAKIAATIRDLEANEELSKSVSARHTLRVAKKISQGFDATKVIKTVFVQAFEDKGEQEQVLSVIQGS